MGCKCYFCNPTQRAKPEPNPPCQLSPKEKVLRQQKQRIMEHMEYLERERERERQRREAERPAREAREKAAQEYRRQQQDKLPLTLPAASSAVVGTQSQAGVKMNPNNMHWPAENFTTRERYEIEWDFSNQETVSLALLTLEEAEEYLENLQQKSAYDNMSEGKNYTGLAMGIKSAYSLGKTLNSYGATARAVVINGVEHIVIENYKPKYLDLGTRWQRSTPQMLKMGLALNTLKGNAQFFKANIIVEIAFSGAVNAADYMMNDEATLREVVKRFSADVIKGVVSGVGAQAFVVGANAGAVAFGVSVPIAGQILLFAISCYLIGLKVSELDNQYKFTDDMIEKIEGLIEGLNE
ncbi:hypothetical protein [uncultured Shewanella sp.]|uniref:hypothetical protein n=1 Tax=uncultured Shewanella sp. TaxID=173975 RepID=UPI002611D75A|nr:hypothetical protein [uncultured Shewanella sp.]